MTKSSIGWFYDKSGNVRYVSAPVNGKLETVQPKNETMTGQIPLSVGCCTNKFDYKHATDTRSRPTTI